MSMSWSSADFSWTEREREKEKQHGETIKARPHSVVQIHYLALNSLTSGPILMF